MEAAPQAQSAIRIRAWTHCAVRHPSLPQTKQRTVTSSVTFRQDISRRSRWTLDQKSTKVSLSLPVSRPVSRDFCTSTTKPCALYHSPSHPRTTTHIIYNQTPKGYPQKKLSVSSFSPPGNSEHPSVQTDIQSFFSFSEIGPAPTLPDPSTVSSQASTIRPKSTSNSSRRFCLVQRNPHTPIPIPSPSLCTARSACVYMTAKLDVDVFRIR